MNSTETVLKSSQEQQDKDVDLTTDFSDDPSAMTEVHEGERLRELLAAKRYEQKQFAEKIGVTKAAVGHWIKYKRFTPRVWERVVHGLTSLNIDPAEIRPTSGLIKRDEQDLTHLVDDWPSDYLVTLRVILERVENDALARRVLLAYIDGSLRQIP